MEKIKHKQEKIRILIFLALLGAIALFFMPRIAQDPSYHLFADARSLFSVSNFWNVCSNIPFLLIGGSGIFYVTKPDNSIIKKLLPHYFIFFAGIFLTGFGSAYYHYKPDNMSLVWDRLPMAISFMSFFSIIIAEFISLHHSRTILFLLLSIGIFSVLYWSYTESRGSGDLRLYIIVQFMPMLLIPSILRLFKSEKLQKKYLWLMLLFYALSKLCETYDLNIYRSLGFISGHSVKHILAAAAPFIFLISLQRPANNKKDPGQE